MGKIENEQILVVYNPRSGNGWQKEALHFLYQNMPIEVQRVSISNINKTDVSGRTVWGWGGDGTHGYLADMIRQNDGTGYLPLDLGSVGDIPKALGWRRQFGESVGGYLNRVVDRWKEKQVSVQEVAGGQVQNQESNSNFLWSAGAGAAVALLSEIERSRKGKCNKLARLFWGVVGYTKAIVEDQRVEVRTSEGEKTMWDCHVVSNTVGRFGGMELPMKEGNVVWEVERPECKAEQIAKAEMVALDILMLRLVGRASQRGVKIRALEPGEEVVLFSKQTGGNLQIDSEVAETPSNTVISMDQPGKPYKIWVPGN